MTPGASETKYIKMQEGENNLNIKFIMVMRYSFIWFNRFYLSWTGTWILNNTYKLKKFTHENKLFKKYFIICANVKYDIKSKTIISYKTILKPIV